MKNEFKNPSPLAPTSTAAGSAPKVRVAKPEAGTAVKRKNTASGGATGGTEHRGGVKASNRPSYGIKTTFQKQTAPEAGHTQANGRIIHGAKNAEAASFGAGHSETAR
jgi:hypothetical protein